MFREICSPQFIEDVLQELASGAPMSARAYKLPAAALGGDVAQLALVVRTIAADAIRRSVAQATFRSKLTQLSLDSALVDTLADAVYAQRDGVIAAVRGRQDSLVGGGGARLADFDWSVRHVVASDKLAAVGDTLLALRLQLANADGSASTLAAELSAAEVDALIGQLEAADAAARAVAGR
jgi:hypothetical protein